MPVRRVFSTLVLTIGLAGALTLPAVLGATPAGANAKSSATFVTPTGTNTGTCAKKAPCKTISFALTQTASGGTVNVAAGTYAENLVVTGNVTISGAGAGNTVIDPTSLGTADVDPDSTTPQYAIVDAQPGASLTLQSLTVNGQGESSAFTSCIDDYVGVFYHDASGTLSNVDIDNVVLPTADFGCQDGLGIYVASDVSTATPSNVSMNGVTVANYDKNGITCDDLGTVCTIKNSTVTGIGQTGLIAQNGIQVWGSSAKITNSVVSGNEYTDTEELVSADGILVYNAADLTLTGNQVNANDDDIYLGQVPGFGAPTGAAPTPGAWDITNNTASDANLEIASFGEGIGDGIELDSSTASVTLSHNETDNDPDFGIALFGVSGATLSSNEGSGDGYGMYVGGPGTESEIDPSLAESSTDNAFSANETLKSQVGIFADTDTGWNTFTKNVASGNSSDDLFDGSTGTGTEGTANSWVKSTCTTSSPAGLCASGKHGNPTPAPPHHHYGPRPKFHS
jgi:hypothetical protein